MESPQVPESSGPLNVRVVSNDMALHRALRASCEREETVDVIGHAALSKPRSADVIVLDVGPPAPSAEELAALREEDDSALVIVVAPEIDSDARELGASVDAVGYLKKGVAVADIAAVVLELAAVGQVKR